MDMDRSGMVAGHECPIGHLDNITGVPESDLRWSRLRRSVVIIGANGLE